MCGCTCAGVSMTVHFKVVFCFHHKVPGNLDDAWQQTCRVRSNTPGLWRTLYMWVDRGTNGEPMPVGFYQLAARQDTLGWREELQYLRALSMHAQAEWRCNAEYLMRGLLARLRVPVVSMRAASELVCGIDYPSSSIGCAPGLGCAFEKGAAMEQMAEASEVHKGRLVEWLRTWQLSAVGDEAFQLDEAELEVVGSHGLSAVARFDALCKGLELHRVLTQWPWLGSERAVLRVIDGSVKLWAGILEFAARIYGSSNQ